MKKILSIFTTLTLIITSIFTMGTSQKVSATTTSGAVNKNVIVYFPNWGIYNQNRQMITVGDIPWDRVTVINHAFFTVNKSFKLETTDDYSDFDKMMPHSEGNEAGQLRGFMAEYKYYKQLYPDVKVLISVGGWTRGENFHEMAKTPATRKIFVDSCIEFLKKYPFIDGFDIDWEYPGVNRAKDPLDEWDRGCPGGPEDKQNFTLLLKELREAYNSNELPNKMLTIANSAGYDKVALQEPDKYIQYLDYINVMTYDMHGAFENVTNHHAAIYPNPNDPSPSSPIDIKGKYNTQEAMKLYTDIYKIPAEKLNVGTPFYSRGWGGVDKTTGKNGLFANATKPHIGTFDNPNSPGGQYPWYQLKAMENSGGWVKYRDEVAKVPYLYNETLGAMLTYEDEQSLSDRCDFVINNGYGGMIVWDISGDDLKKDFPMTTLLYNKIGPQIPVDQPMKPMIISDKPINSGSFNLTINIPKKSRAVLAKLYENDKLIDTIAVTPDSTTISTIKKTMTKDFGEYNYRIDLISAQGKITSNSTKVTCKLLVNGPPTTPYLEHSNWFGATSFDLNMVNYGGENGSQWKLYENDKLIYTGELKYNGTIAQRATYKVENKSNGTYTYYCELINPDGVAKSKTVDVVVTQGSNVIPPDDTLPKVSTVSSSVNPSKDGAYLITGAIPADSKADSYVLYENDISVKTGAVSGGLTTVTYEVKGKDNGNYKYKMVLKNAKGETPSQELVVNVNRGDQPPVQDLDVGFLITSDWGTAANWSITITNTSGKDINGWEVEFTSDLNINQCWDCTFTSLGNGKYKISNPAWGGSIKKDGKITLTGACSGPTLGKGIKVTSIKVK